MRTVMLNQFLTNFIQNGSSPFLFSDLIYAKVRIPKCIYRNAFSVTIFCPIGNNRNAKFTHIAHCTRCMFITGTRQILRRNLPLLQN